MKMWPRSVIETYKVKGKKSQLIWPWKGKVKKRQSVVWVCSGGLVLVLQKGEWNPNKNVHMLRLKRRKVNQSSLTFSSMIFHSSKWWIGRLADMGGQLMLTFIAIFCCHWKGGNQSVVWVCSGDLVLVSRKKSGVQNKNVYIPFEN